MRTLIEKYQVYFVADTDDMAEKAAWLEEYIGVPAWRHTVFTNQRHLLYGDYLISSRKEHDPMATQIEYGSDVFKTWDDTMEYFSRLGGQ